MAVKKKDEGKKNRVLVLGIGNILLKDEGFGVRALDAFTHACALPQNVKCVDGGTAGLNLLTTVKGFSHIIILDAVLAQSPPGTLHRLTEKTIDSVPLLKTSAHELGIKELLFLTRFQDSSPKIAVIGVTPHDVSPGLDLSPAVKDALPKAVRAICDELGKLHITVKERPHDARAVDSQEPA